MGAQISQQIACSSNGTVDNDPYSFQFPIFYLPNDNPSQYIISCQATISDGEQYRQTQQKSLYDCVNSCDINALCYFSVFDPTVGTCTEFVTVTTYSYDPSYTTEYIARSAGFFSNAEVQGSTCVPGQYGNYTIECGIDYVGGDMGAQYDMMFKDCIDLCDSTSGCIDVAYNGGACYMKSSLGPQVTNGAVWTARQSDASRGLSCINNFSNGKTHDGFLIQCGIDYFGNDMGSTSTSTFENCIDTCASTTGCVDVSYAGNMCYMKYAVGQPSTNGNVWTAKSMNSTSSTKNPSTTDPAAPTCDKNASNGTTYNGTQGVYNIYCNFEYYGGDLKYAQTDTFVECISACDNTPGCIDVSYTGNSCYMKNVLGTQRTGPGLSTAVLASAVKSAPPNTLSCDNDQDNLKTYTAAAGDNFTVACGTDYYGGDLSNTVAQTFQVCIDTCDKTEGCLAVSYRSPNCYMKNVVNPAVSDSSVWGATKDQSSSTTTTTTSATTSDDGYATATATTTP